MQGIDQIRQLTNDFFSMHWKAEILGSPAIWADPFLAASSGPYPNHNLQGCYALFTNEELRYVGVASSRGWGRYKGEGIGARIKHVVAVDWRSKTPAGKRMYRLRDNWSDITHISTIGFSPTTGYVAAALEHYLLGKLEPSEMRNKCRPGSI